MRSGYRVLLCFICISICWSVEFKAGAGQASEASLYVDANQPQAYRIPRNLTGKFCEHLGANIYNGMDAQILRNPTFADYPFATPEGTPDGLSTFHFEHEKIDAELRRQATRSGWPQTELGPLLKARQDGLACFWSRKGPPESVKVSPDTAPWGQRAQRVQLQEGAGIKQWTWLPLHRQHKYQFELMARSPELKQVQLSIIREGSDSACAEVAIEGLASEWRSIAGTLVIPENQPGDVPYCVVLSVPAPGQLVIGHLFLRPADHVNGADPDIVALLRAAHLPLLRWPGGNFVSAYHWQEGVGPADHRPALPNFAWGGIEPNTFGTDEFISFCRAVGCEPMICINAGTGTPEEAARWVQYCNGPADSEFGARRAANGHPAAFHVRHWEVGNELWGRWQARWTTAEGYVDRYRQFAAAMKKADPDIELHACGAPVLWGKSWNDTLINDLGSELHGITDHPLIGGDVSPLDDPMDIFRDFMHVPDVLSQKWEELRLEMTKHGITEPGLAVTELQMFAHLRGQGNSQSQPKLTQQELVNPATLAEALYDTLIYHAAARLQPFIEMVTHSATVNHGGGLRKEHERVYANPCYYANLLFANFADAQPLRTELKAPVEQAHLVLPDLKRSTNSTSFSAVDALAAISTNGTLLISLVHRGSSGPIRLKVQLDGFDASDRAALQSLSGTEPWDVNTLDHPHQIEITRSEAQVLQNTLTLTLEPFSLVQIGLTSRY